MIADAKPPAEVVGPVSALGGAWAGAAVFTEAERLRIALSRQEGGCLPDVGPAENSSVGWRIGDMVSSPHAGETSCWRNLDLSNFVIDERKGGRLVPPRGTADSGAQAEVPVPPVATQYLLPIGGGGVAPVTVSGMALGMLAATPATEDDLRRLELPDGATEAEDVPGIASAGA